MLSSQHIVSLFIATACAASCGCSRSPADGENVIGRELESLYSPNISQSRAAQKAVVFDSNVRRIHQFDLSAMAMTSLTAVKYPDEAHYMFADNEYNYIVDFTTKHFTIYPRSGPITEDPVAFAGIPQSVAFNDQLGVLVFYDGYSTVVILKLSKEGQILNSWVGGPKVDGVNTIRSGDLDTQGNLVLALSNDSLLVVNINLTLEQKKWVYGSPQPTSYKNISWVAPLSGGSENVVFLKSDDALAIYNLDSQTVLDSMSYSGKEIIKFSKEPTAHVILKGDSLFSSVYARSSDKKLGSTEIIWKTSVEVYSSQIDLENDLWSLVIGLPVTSGRKTINDPNQIRMDRQFIQYRLSDLLVTSSFPLPNEAQVLVLSNAIFSYYPSVLGFAEIHSHQGVKSGEFKGFNFPYIQ